MAPDFTTGIWYLERGNVDTGKSYQTHGAGTVGPMPVRQQINPSTYRKEGSIGGQSKFDAVVIEEGVSALGSLCHPCSSGWGGGVARCLPAPPCPGCPPAPPDLRGPAPHRSARSQPSTWTASAWQEPSVKEGRQKHEQLALTLFCLCCLAFLLRSTANLCSSRFTSRRVPKIGVWVGL